VGILLSILFTLGLMNKNNEILALNSNGVSVYYLLRSIFIIGILFSVFYFILSEQIMPIIKSKESEIWAEVKKEKDVVTSKKESIWIKSGNIISRVSHFNARNQVAFNIALYYFDKEFNLTRRIDAKKGVYKNGTWSLYEIIEQTFDKGNRIPRVKIHKKMKQDLDISPEDLRRTVKHSEEMNFGELMDYIEKIESEGYDSTIYRVDLYAKTAHPFICIIMSIVGAGIALNRKLRNSLPLVILSGLGVIFLYYVFYSFCLSIGYGGVIPPFISAWAPNFIFMCTGAVAVIYAE
ncbi:MAG: LptF/LptG family permease, partial [Desulfobacterales bacterium]|nr:LptF/LptG family permease [Desulfobacterales bacterium]